MSNAGKRYEGETRDWNFERNFGFIDYEDSGVRRTIFYSGRNTQADWRGSRGWAFDQSIPVTFTISRTPYKNKKYAEDVAPVFPMSEPEDLAGYRETSEVFSKTFDCGFLKRPCGDLLFFHLVDVVEQFRDRWNLLEIGSPVFHGARFDEATQRWRSDYIELYSSEELQSFKNESEPQIEAEPVPEVLAPANRVKTIAQLIAERRVGHELSPQNKN